MKKFILGTFSHSLSNIDKSGFVIVTFWSLPKPLHGHVWSAYCAGTVGRRYFQKCFCIIDSVTRFSGFEVMKF